ncbi:MAG: FixH family protein, partial [Mesorhizobium sp.]|nr:FixH family protein [Mesorhizobium sp.]
LHNWVLTVTTPDGNPVEGATIAVDGGMPQHGHGLPTAPAATSYLGEGRYRIEGVRFNMGGWWEFKFAIEAAPGADAVTFNLSL